MKDKRIISVKNPKLRKIRDELREVLNCFAEAEWNKIFDERKRFLYDTDGKRRTVDDMKPEEVKQFRELQSLKNKNREIARKSICMCYNCGKPDQDMFYNYPYRAWFCVECVKFLKMGHAKMKAKKAHGEYTCDPDDEFGQSFF